jgi:AraC family transcriptional regulator
MDHKESVQAAVDYIEARLSEELTLADIAAQALFSPWQFHRVFTVMVGMPVMAYVRARRLAEAARALMETDRRVIEIAQDVGYESQQAFTRAFVKAFGITPGACRSSKRLPDTLVPAGEWSYERRMEMCMEPSIVSIEDFWVMGLKAATSVEENMADYVIPKLWERFFSILQTGIPGRIGSDVSYGVCMGGEGETFTYLAGVPVDQAVAVPEGMEKQRVAGGEYAVFTHRWNVGNGELDGLYETNRYIYGQWLPDSGYEFDRTRMDFERYGPAFCADPPELEIWIPIKKK